MRRPLSIIGALSVVAGGAFLLPALSEAASGTGAYGSWTLTDGKSGTITFPGTIFPAATVTSTNENLQLATSATLSASTPFGLAYGPSNGKQYLSAALAAGKASGTVTLTFDTPPTPGTYGFALGDIDAENIRITASDASGRALNVSEWLGTTFNYSASGTDLPNWDASTGTLSGNGVDTDGASLFFVTSDEVKEITFEQVRSAGFPRFQLWIAADIITTKPVPAPTATARPIIPPAPPGKVIICHRTNSRNNPYVQITVSEDSIDRRNGHDTHDGPIFPAANWGDIIPPFPSFPGQNWPAGSAILNNGCEVGGEVLTAPVASPSASPSASGTASGTASPSASAGASDSASASPSATASSAASASASASPSGSASPSLAATGTPSPSPSETAAPQPEETSTPTVVTIDPEDPAPVPADPKRPTTIDPGPGNTITDVDEPDRGTVIIRDGDVIYTPPPNYVGPVEIPITITDRNGNTSRAVIIVNVGEVQTTRAILPTALKIGENLLLARPAVTNAKQVAKVSVTCTPRMRLGKADGVGLCSSYRVGAKTYLWINGPATVKVTLSAPKKGAFGALAMVRTYTVRSSR